MKKNWNIAIMFSIYLLGAITYIMNIVQALDRDFTTLHLSIKVIGVFIPPLGMMMGVFDY